MRITANNYKHFFSSFNEKFDSIKVDNNPTLKGALTKLKEEFDRKEHGSDVLLADNSVLKIGIVGQVKAGKSSFLNSLFFDGENILPRASTPMTAGLTMLKYGDSNKFIVEYFSKKEWQYFVDKAAEYDKLVEMAKAQNPGITDSDAEKMLNIDDTKLSAKEMVSKCSRLAQSNVQDTSKKEEKAFSQIGELKDILEDYVGANGKLTSIVKCLTLELNDERLKDLQIVDTPGVNDPVLSREMRTREFLQECHGVFFLSNSTSFFGAADVNFLVNRIGSQGIGTVVLIGSMLDAGLMDASGKYFDDLGNALDYVKTSLERQYKHNIADADFAGDDPILDFCSGIGYSIAMKSRTHWDAMEAHVVSRMCELYPSFFDTDDSIKDMFEALANIDGNDGIRAKYLEGVFRDNRDKIINQKMDSYFANASSELSKVFESCKDDISSQLRALQDCDNPAERRKAMVKLVENMKADLLNIMSRADSRADKAVKEVMNGYSMNWNGNIPVILSSVTCYRTSTFRGRDKSFSFNMETVDVNALANNINSLVDRCLRDVSNKWDKKSIDIRSFISDSINDFITEQEKQDAENNIDGRMLNSILNDTLDQMSNEATIDISTIKNRIESDILGLLQGCGEIDQTVGTMEEGPARNEMSRRVQEKKVKVSNDIHNYLSSLYGDVINIIKNASKASTSCINDRKDEFIKHITEEINLKIDELQVQIQNREKNVALLSNAITKLNEIQQNL